MPDISIILPVYNTAASLQPLHARLCAALSKTTDSVEIIIVDDGSPDGAWNMIEHLAGEDPRVKGLKLSRNFGQHRALAAGLARAEGQIIVMMDSDLQDPPEAIPHMLQQLKDNVDVVYTARANVTESWLSRTTSRLYHAAFSALTGTKAPPAMCLLRAFTRRFADALLAHPEKNVLFGPLMLYLGFQSVTVSVANEKRRHGKSSYSFRKRLGLAVNSLISYTDLPHRVLLSCGAAIMLACFLYILFLVGTYLVGTQAPPGWTMVAVLIVFSLGMMMFGFGVLGTYIYRIYQEVLQRPRFVIAREINTTVAAERRQEDENKIAA